METKIKELQEQLEVATGEIKTLLGKQDAEIKAHGETNSATAKELKAAEKRMDDISAEMKAAGEKIEKQVEDLEAKINRPGFGGQPEQRKTPGQMFVESVEYKSAQEGGRYETAPVKVGDLFAMKQVVGDPVATDSPVFAQRVPGYFFDPAQRELTIRDIMNVAPTTSNSIEYVLEQTFDEDGAEAQEREGAQKQEADMTFEIQTVPVSTLAHWIPASRQVLADAPMLQSHIDSRLLYSVRKKEEDHILFGDGAQGRMLGIHNTPGIQEIGAPGAGESRIDHIRRAYAMVRSSEYNATGIILHPMDWMRIELEKGTDDHYIWVTVPDGGVSRLWRVPVLETTAMEEGRFLTGAFGLGAQLWDRQSAQIRLSEHHLNYFTRNLVAILAELRVALTVYRPLAFCRGVFPEWTST